MEETNIKNFDDILEESHMMTKEENLRENQKYAHLMEMSVLRKHETGLPVNIWVDEGQTYKLGGHWKRIKFQDDKADHPDSNSMIPMSISENPKVNVKNYKLPEQDINLIKQFVKINLDILLKLGDSIGIVEFTKQMRRVENGI